MTVEFKSNVGRIRNDTQDPTAESLLDLIKSPPPPLDHEIKTPHWTWVKVDLNQRLGDTRKKVEFVCESTVLYGRACDGVD